MEGEEALGRTRGFLQALRARLAARHPEAPGLASWTEASRVSVAGLAHADGLRYVPPDLACRAYRAVSSCTGAVGLARVPASCLAELPEDWAQCMDWRWRGLRLECGPSCPGEAGRPCTSQWIQRNQPCPVVAVAPCVSLEGGYGVYAAEVVESGQFIGEYKGAISRYESWAADIEQLKASRGQHQEWPYISEELYGMSVTEPGLVDFIVDGFHEGSFARFVNHSCRPNCSIEHVVTWDGGHPRLAAALFTTRRIEQFEQLSINYSWYQDNDDTNETTVLVKQEAARLLDGRAAGIDDEELALDLRLELLETAATNVGIRCCCRADQSLNPSGECSGIIGWTTDGLDRADMRLELMQRVEHMQARLDVINEAETCHVVDMSSS